MFLIVQGDARQIPLPDNSVHTICTSVPFFNLRDYGTGRWEGGDAGCEHKPRTREGINGQRANRANIDEQNGAYRESCYDCGARRIDKQIGLESTLTAYLAELLIVFREVWRILRNDGVLFLECGDSYNANGRQGHGTRIGYKQGTNKASANGSDGCRSTDAKLKPLDLIGVPWRIALMLQAEGWYLRSDTIWHHVSCMPESVQGSQFNRHMIGTEECPGCPKCEPHGGYVLRMNAGRPTKAHSYVFILSKSEKYYFDSEGVRESHQPASLKRVALPLRTNRERDYPGSAQTLRMGEGQQMCHPNGRNIRSVLPIPGEGFTSQTDTEHFAVMPTALAEICVKAGSSQKGVCRKCGAPWVRIVEKGEMIRVRQGSDTNGARTQELATGKHGTSSIFKTGMKPTLTTLGWIPSCLCKDAGDPIPAIVFDPFGGACTTSLVADRLGRHGVSLDLSHSYCLLGKERLTSEAPLFAPRSETLEPPVTDSLFNF